MVLRKEDKQLISYYIENYACNPGSNITHERTYNMDIILKPWFHAKSEYLFKIFNNQLILEREVEYNEPISQMKNANLKSLSGGKMSHFYNHLCRFVDTNFHFTSDEASALWSLVDCEALVNNKVNHCGTHIVWFNNNEDSIKIQEGAKVMKLLAKIAKSLNAEESFEEFRLEHSRILNQKKLKGTLCLSIHPMDYMTMSDNDNNWSSCMSWRHHTGDYRQGTVEMMNSPCVVVGYLKADTSMDLGYEYYWNSKKWRSLFIVNKNLIVSVKDYPFYCPELLKTCTEWLRELANANSGWNFPYESDVIPIDAKFTYINKQNYYISPSTDWASMYNDFNCTNAHYGALSTMPGMDRGDFQAIEFNYAGVNECMWCGYTNSDFYEDSYVICTDCCTGENQCVCYDCGYTMDEDDAYWLDDTPYCWDCYCDRTEECAISSERYYPEELANVYLLRGDEELSEESPSIRIYKGYFNSYCPPNSNFNCTPRFDEASGLYYWYESDITHPDWYFNI